jgi:hypothetical protein
MESIMLQESTTSVWKDSKTVYINDSYNLDTPIPFDVNKIINTDKLVDIEYT